MANRTIQQKILKMKRRGRYARFSGKASVHAERVERVAIHIDDEKTMVKEILIPVGKISLSKSVISTGRGPDPERMQEYYSRVSAKSYSSDLPPTKGMTEPMKELKAFEERLKGTVPVQNRIELARTLDGVLLLFYASGGKQWFFVEIDYKTGTFKRSRDYNTKQQAMERLNNRRVSWVEVISPK